MREWSEKQMMETLQATLEDGAAPVALRLKAGEALLAALRRQGDAMPRWVWGTAVKQIHGRGDGDVSAGDGAARRAVVEEGGGEAASRGDGERGGGERGATACVVSVVRGGGGTTGEAARGEFPAGGRGEGELRRRC